MSMWDTVEFGILKGRVISHIERRRESGDELILHMEDGVRYKMHHHQDCCESVTIEDITGDFTDLVGSPLLVAEESSQLGKDGDFGDTSTWTFYKLATIKGSVDIRWLGTSNGYYSESVDLYEMDPDEE